jgi:hypothetical protein
MIDRQYGHLARDGREHAIRLLDELSAGTTATVDAGGRCVDAETSARRQQGQRNRRSAGTKAAKKESAEEL